MITVVLVDDQEVIRVGLRAILSDRLDIEVVGEVGDGLSAVRIVTELSPDVVLMDLRMPGIDGVEATRRIRARQPELVVRILVLTTFDQDANVLAPTASSARAQARPSWSTAFCEWRAVSTRCQGRR